jgi:hypothetical protein
MDTSKVNDILADFEIAFDKEYPRDDLNQEWEDLVSRIREFACDFIKQTLSEIKN